MKTPKCPRCKQYPDRFIEYSDAMTQTYDVIDAETGEIDQDGYFVDGDIVRVRAECRCGHKWTVRKLKRVEDLSTHPEAIRFAAMKEQS